MKQLIILLVFSFATISVTGRRVCDACFDEVCYTKSLIFKEHPITGQLAVDRRNNIIYFHYEGLTNHTVGYNMNEKTFLMIPDIEFSFARTVDQTTKEVYISGTTGIYKYNPVDDVTSYFGLQDKTIWHMQFKNKLYYTIHSIKGLYTFEENQHQSIAALNDFHIDEFIVDRKDNIYFMSNFTVYKLTNGSEKPTLFSNVIYSLSTDIYDNAYFVQREDSGLYKIDYKTGKMKEMGSFGNASPFSSVFHRFNNIIYYDIDTSELNYLVPNYARCKVKTEGSGRELKKMILPPDSEVKSKSGKNVKP